MKQIISLLVLLVLISSFAAGQEIPEDPYEDVETCVGFWGKTKCVLFGDPARQALVGEAAAPPSDDDINKAKQLREEARSLYNEGNYQEALSKIDEALRLTPENPNYHGAKGIYLQAQGKHQEAIQSFNKALELPGLSNDLKLATEQKIAESQIGLTQTPQQQAASVNLFLEGRETTATPTATPGTPTAPGTPESLQQAQQTALRNALGETIYKKYIGENGEFFNQYQVSAGELKRSDGTTITMSPLDSEGFRTVRVAAKNEKGEDVIFNTLNLNNQEIATQTESGEIEVAGQTVPLSSGQSIDSLKTGSLEYGKTDDKLGGRVAVASDLGEVLLFNYDDETRWVKNTKTGEIEQTSGDYYQEGESDCGASVGCYFADGGTLRVPIDVDGDGEIDPETEMIPYSVDYDHDGTGGDRDLTRKEFYDRRGNRVGTESGGTRVLAKKTDDENIYEIRDGEMVVNARREGDNWVAVSELVESNPQVQQAQAKYDAAQEEFDDYVRENPGDTNSEEYLEKLKGLGDSEEELNEAKQEAGEDAQELINDNKEQLDNTYSTTEGALATTQDVFESIYAVTSQMRQFPALSKLIFGESEFYQDWIKGVDQTFAPALGTNWFPSFCETDDRWADIEPEGKAVIKTVSGTYQAVASIQLERTETRTPILCHKNPDEDADEEFICGRDQVCVDDNFCWRDENGDGEPDRDEEEPLEGYFYKVTWAVTSPQDEQLTPLVDENGVAVSFNVILNPTSAPFGIPSTQSIPLYNREGNIISPIELRNGESDRDAIIKYSPNLYQEACIVWHQPPLTVNIFAEEGVAVGTSEIPNVCFQAVTSEVGRVNWERSGQGGASVSGSEGEITRNTDW